MFESVCTTVLPENVDHSVPFELQPEGYNTVTPININNEVNNLVNNESGPRRSTRLKQKQAARQASSTAGHTNMQLNGCGVHAGQQNVC